MKIKKRILLASMFFDCGTAPNHMYQPTVNWYFDFTDEEKPVHAVIKYAWQDKELKYPFNDRLKNLFIDGGLIEFSKSIFRDCGYKYDGEMNIDIQDEFYISPKGHEIGFVKDFKTACSIYQK